MRDGLETVQKGLIYTESEIDVLNRYRRSADPEWGAVIIIEPDPRFEQMRRLDVWLSQLTVWQQYLLALPLALIHAGLSVWLNSLLPAVNPTLIRF